MANKETITIKLPSGGSAVVRGYLTSRDRIAISARDHESSLLYSIHSLLLSFNGKDGADGVEEFLSSKSQGDFDAVLEAIISLAEGGGDSLKKSSSSQ